MPERSTFDDHAYAVPGAQNTWRTPAAAALRRIEPTLPASCTPSSTTDDCVTRSGSGCAGRSTSSRKPTPLTTFDNCPNNASGSVTIRCESMRATIAWASAWPSAPSVVTHSSGVAPVSRYALARWNPSSSAWPPRR
ncbi:hypothetical protein BGI28_07660 [Burkholderia contaminans]|nr:hypothetical protein BGI28_07660 [Burkholderia contaminans]